MYNIYFNNVALATIRTSEKLKLIAHEEKDDALKEKLLELRQESVLTSIFLGAIILAYHEYEHDPYLLSVDEVTEKAEKYMNRILKRTKKTITKELTE